MTRCKRQGCPNPAPRPVTGRPGRWCSSACRQAGYRVHKRRSVHFRSDSAEWYTPPEIFEEYSERFGPFGLDAAADERSPIWPLVGRHLTVADDGLNSPWTGRVWLNPPYGREIGRWTSKAAFETEIGRAELVCALVPARTDTRWWNDARAHGAEADFRIGRIRFFAPDGTRGAGAAFPSAVLVFRNAFVTGGAPASNPTESR